jgi:hypothetical protein
MISRVERILILCKTYPSPSAGYTETSCVAGIDESGKLIRIYPMPFRIVNDEQQFKKWQWISARIEKASKDHRPESHRIFVDTIECDASPIPAGEAGWRVRRHWLNRITLFKDFESIEAARISKGSTLALLRPKRILGLDIKKATAPDWTEDERTKLLQMQSQGDLFSADDEPKTLRLLKKSRTIFTIDTNARLTARRSSVDTNSSTGRWVHYFGMFTGNTVTLGRNHFARK